MLRRPSPRPRLRTPAAAALVLLLALAGPAGAASLTDPIVYRLTNGGSKPIDYAFLGFAPSGAIVDNQPDPTDPTGQRTLSPVTIVGHSDGFRSDLPDAGILDYKLQASGPVQQSLGFDFQGTDFGKSSQSLGGQALGTPIDNSLKPGQFIDFTVAVQPKGQELTWSFIDPPASAGLTLQALAPTTGPDTTPPPTPPPVNTPEPLSLLAWSTVAALGLARAHAFRRARRAPAAAA